MDIEVTPGVPAPTPTAPVAAPTPAAPAPVAPVAAEPAPTPAPAPVAAPTSDLFDVEDPGQTVASELGADGAVTYEPTGDAALDVALDFVGRLGISGDHPAIAAAARGDFSLLEANLAVLGDKAQGWQQMVNLAKDAFTRSQANYAQQIKATDAAILGVAQSAENWNAIKTWAAQNADPAEKAEINRMIDAGPFQARAAATLLLNAYKAATGTTINPPNPASAASGNSPASNTGKLNGREYSVAVAELHRKLGASMETSQEYKALRARLA